MVGRNGRAAGWWRAGVVAAALWTGSATLASGSIQHDEPAVAGALAAEIAALGDASFATREAASARLAAPESPFSLAELEHAGMVLPLNEEQRARLLVAARARFISTPRGAMGVRFDQTSPEVVVMETLPGFPSTEVLRPGDRILAVDGIEVGGSRDVRPSIIRHDPGDTAMLLIERAGVRRQVALRLGRFDLLGGQGPGQRQDLSESDLAEGWALRSERLARSGESPLTPTLPRGWMNRDGEARRAYIEHTSAMSDAAARALRPDLGDRAAFMLIPGVVAGGEARGGTRYAEQNFELQTAAADAERAGVRIVGDDPELAKLLRAQEELFLSFRESAMAMADPTLAPAQRAQAEARYHSTRRQLMELNQRITDRMAEAEVRPPGRPFAP